MTAAWIAARFIHFAAAMAAFGIGAFRIYAFSGGTVAADAPARIALDRQLASAMLIAAIVAFLTALAIVPAIAVEMTGSDTAALDPSVWQAVLLATEFGKVWRWHLGFAVVLMVLSAVPQRRWRSGAATLAAFLLLASLGLIGHAAMDMGGGPTHEINQMAHLIAGGIWLGGLVPLGVLLRHATRPESDAFVSLARSALPHFSQMGYAAVTLLAVTGTVNAVILVGSFEALATTPYGRLLCVKLALFAAMISLALINRFRLLPKLRQDADATTPLRALFRSVIAEQSIGLAILAVVAVLGTWPPAIEAGMSM